MPKAEIFALESKVECSGMQNWLAENPNIEIVAAPSFANEFGWGVILVYNELESGDTH